MFGNKLSLLLHWSIYSSAGLIARSQTRSTAFSYNDRARRATSLLMYHGTSSVAVSAKLQGTNVLHKFVCNEKLEEIIPGIPSSVESSKG